MARSLLSPRFCLPAALAGILLLLIGCGGGGGGGGETASPVSGGLPSGYSVNGTVSFGPTAGASVRAGLLARPALADLQVVLRTSQGTLLSAPVVPAADGRFAFGGVPAGVGYEVAVLATGSRTLLVALIDRLQSDLPSLTVDPGATALAILYRSGAGSRSLADLQTAVTGGTLDLSTVTREIGRWLDDPASLTGTGDVSTAVTTALGADALQRLVTGTPAPAADPIRLSAPLSGAVIDAGSDLTLEAVVGYTGAWRKVEFLQNGFKLGETATSPFRFVWTKVPAGSYALTAHLVLPDWSRLPSPVATVTCVAATNHAPLAASLVAPASGARRLFGSVELQTAAFTDPDAGDYHLRTDWEVATEPTFTVGTPFWQRLGDAAGKTKITVAGLATGTVYYARARLYDQAGLVGPWSPAISFRTMGFAPQIVWAKCLGGSQEDAPAGIARLDDGGFLIMATSRSSDGDVSVNNGGRDIWLTRLSATGELLWQRTLGGVGVDTPLGWTPPANGAFSLLAWSDSPDGDFFDLDAQGQPRFGFRSLIQSFGLDGSKQAGFFLYPPLLDQPAGLVPDGSGNLWIGGNAVLREGGYTAPTAAATLLQVKPGPELLRTLNGKDWNNQTLVRISPRPDGGVLMMGLLGSGAGTKGYAVITAIGADGQQAWRQVISDREVELDPADPANFAVKAEGAADKGAFIVFPAGFDATAIRLDAAAGQKWRKTLPLFLPGVVLEQTDGTCLMGGLGPARAGEHGWCRLMKLDPEGNLIGQRNFGGTSGQTEIVTGLCSTADGGFVTVAFSAATDGDVSGNHGGGDLWVVKWQDLSE